jgi:hypothetical protein
VSCDDSWPDDQRFRLEFVGSGLARLHASGGQCITAPETLANHALPGFGPCDGTRDVFDVGDGELSQNEFCLTTEGATVVFEMCSDALTQKFAFSGPFGLGGSALTLSPTSGSGPHSLSATPLGIVPDDDQIFDYHF